MYTYTYTRFVIFRAINFTSCWGDKGCVVIANLSTDEISPNVQCSVEQQLLYICSHTIYSGFFIGYNGET